MKKWNYDYIVDANGGGDFRTVQEAIDAGGKTIFVKPGTYNGNAVIIGKDGPLVIDGGN